MNGHLSLERRPVRRCVKVKFPRALDAVPLASRFAGGYRRTNRPITLPETGDSPAVPGAVISNWAVGVSAFANNGEFLQQPALASGGRPALYSTEVHGSTGSTAN